MGPAGAPHGSAGLATDFCKFANSHCLRMCVCKGSRPSLRASFGFPLDLCQAPQSSELNRKIEPFALTHSQHLRIRKFANGTGESPICSSSDRPPGGSAKKHRSCNGLCRFANSHNLRMCVYRAFSPSLSTSFYSLCSLQSSSVERAKSKKRD